MIKIVIKGEDQTGEAVQSAAGNMERLGATAEKQGGLLQGFFSFMGGAAVAGAAAMGGALVAAGGAGLSMNNAMEQARAQIMAFTKDAAKTTEILEMVRERAAKTPFAFQDMATAAGALIPSAKQAKMELEDLLAVAEVLAASNPAEGLAGAAFAIKEAVSGDFTSIIERFNLPRQYINELKEQGVPNIEIVRRAMQQLGLDADLVASMANTMQGRWSTFMDTLQGTAAIITQPLFDTLSAGLGQVNAMLEANAPQLEAFAQMMAGKVANAIQFVQTQIIPFVASFVQGFMQAGKGAQQFGAIIETTRGVVQNVFTNILSIAQTILSALSNFWRQNGATILATAQQTWQTISQVIQQVMSGIMAVVQAILPVIAQFWRQNGADIMATAQQTWQTVVQIVQITGQIIQTVLQALAGFIRAHGSEINAILTTAWNVVKGVIQSALDIIRGVLTAALAAMRGDWQGAWNAIVEAAQSIGGRLQAAIQAAAPAVKAAMAALGEAAKQGFQSVVAGASQLGRDLVNGIASGVNAAAGAIADAVRKAIDNAIAAAKRSLGIKSPSLVMAEVIGRPLVEGVALGITQSAPMAVAAMTTMASSLTYAPSVSVDARGATLTRDQIEQIVRRVLDQTANDAALRRRV